MRAFFSATFFIAAKEIRGELRSRRLVTQMTLFAFLAVLIFYFTLEGQRSAVQVSLPAILWVIVTFAGTLGVGRSLAAEHEHGTLDGLLLAPIPRASLFYGKLIGTWLFTVCVVTVALLALTVFFNVGLFIPALLGVILLGTLGLAAVGTLLGSLAAAGGGRETLLPILILPIALPIILASVRATSDILNDLPFTDWGLWLPILAGIDGVFLVLAFVLFDYVVEQ
jgi:heme exporter protein B